MPHISEKEFGREKKLPTFQLQLSSNSWAVKITNLEAFPKLHSWNARTTNGRQVTIHNS